VTDPRRSEPTTSWTNEPRPSEPRMQIAADLESAAAPSFVYVDNSGRVRAPWRYRMRQIGSWSLLLILALASASVFAPFGGFSGLVAALVVLALVLHLALLSSWIHRGVVFLAHDQLELAERLLARASRLSLHQVGMRALADQNRAALAQRRGDHRAALRLNRRALAICELLPRPLGRGLNYHLLRYGEVVLLCNLDQPGAARKRLATIPKSPPGEYILLRRWTAELYLALVEGKLELDWAALEQRTARAERLRASPELLALCAWGWDALGDRSRAVGHAMTARRLEGVRPFAQSLPLLGRWIDAVLTDVDQAEPPNPSGAGS
jgi:hypothetical protein